LLAEQLLEIIFTFFTVKVLPEFDPDPMLPLELPELEEGEDAPILEPESEPFAGVPETRT
jgi:hypothetical protein